MGNPLAVQGILDATVAPVTMAVLPEMSMSGGAFRRVGSPR
jgi:hypothetical protein